jgi:hypothetical protein
VVSPSSGIDKDSGPHSVAELILFAAAVLTVMMGASQAFAGLLGPLSHPPRSASHASMPLSAAAIWGWVDLTAGTAAMLTGFAVLAGQAWSRWAGIGLAVLIGLANFHSLPDDALWSLLTIAVAAFVAWALAMYGKAVAGLWSELEQAGPLPEEHDQQEQEEAAERRRSADAHPATEVRRDEEAGEDPPADGVGAPQQPGGALRPAQRLGGDQPVEGELGEQQPDGLPVGAQHGVAQLSVPEQS